MLDDTRPNLNLTTLASTSMAELLDLLAQSVRSDDAMEPRPDQLAEYVLAETVRLIRLGTRPELADASAILSRLLTARVAEELTATHPAAHTLLNSAADVLAAAASPASRGGEFAVLRSYSGKALEALWHVARAEHRAVARTQLLALMEIEESYMSHILADLETAGLIERIRGGRNVTVHLGPRGYTTEVQQYLQAQAPESIPEARRESSRDERSHEPIDEFARDALRRAHDTLDGIENAMRAGLYLQALRELLKLGHNDAGPVPQERITELTTECLLGIPGQGVGTDQTAPGIPQAVDRRLVLASFMLKREMNRT
jgi:DNA-binding MarR family transcriptional regulator